MYMLKAMPSPPLDLPTCDKRPDKAPGFFPPKQIPSHMHQTHLASPNANSGPNPVSNPSRTKTIQAGSKHPNQNRSTSASWRVPYPCPQSQSPIEKTGNDPHESSLVHQVPTCAPGSQHHTRCGILRGQGTPAGVSTPHGSAGFSSKQESFGGACWRSFWTPRRATLTASSVRDPGSRPLGLTVV